MGGGGSRWGGGRDRDRIGGPVSRGPGGPSSGPNPLMGSLVGKPTGGPMGYSGERKSRFDDKRDGDDFDRFSRVGPPGVDQDSDESMDKGGRFGDGGFRGGRGGFRGGRGGGPPDRSGDRSMGGGRFGGNQFRPNNGGGMRGSGGFNRNRDDGGSGGRFYGGRGGGGGGPPGRDNRDGRVSFTEGERASLRLLSSAYFILYVYSSLYVTNSFNLVTPHLQIESGWELHFRLRDRRLVDTRPR